jgi:hypothetical protein
MFRTTTTTTTTTATTATTTTITTTITAHTDFHVGILYSIFLLKCEVRRLDTLRN